MLNPIEVHVFYVNLYVCEISPYMNNDLISFNFSPNPHAYTLTFKDYTVVHCTYKSKFLNFGPTFYDIENKKKI